MLDFVSLSVIDSPSSIGLTASAFFFHRHHQLLPVLLPQNRLFPLRLLLSDPVLVWKAEKPALINVPRHALLFVIFSSCSPSFIPFQSSVLLCRLGTAQLQFSSLSSFILSISPSPISLEELKRDVLCRAVGPSSSALFQHQPEKDERPSLVLAASQTTTGAAERNLQHQLVIQLPGCV